MGRLFAGTPWDRPPTCDRCGKPESECAIAHRPVVEPLRIAPPGSRTANQLWLEKRPKGEDASRPSPASTSRRGTTSPTSPHGSRRGAAPAQDSAKDSVIELQGGHLTTQCRGGAWPAIGCKMRPGLMAPGRTTLAVVGVIFLATLIRSAFSFGEAAPWRSRCSPSRSQSGSPRFGRDARPRSAVACVVLLQDWQEVHVASVWRLVLATFAGHTPGPCSCS